MIDLAFRAGRFAVTCEASRSCLFLRLGPLEVYLSRDPCGAPSGLSRPRAGEVAFGFARKTLLLTDHRKAGRPTAV